MAAITTLLPRSNTPVGLSPGQLSDTVLNLFHVAPTGTSVSSTGAGQGVRVPDSRGSQACGISKLTHTQYALKEGRREYA
jgi:hypothetical protein